MAIHFGGSDNKKGNVVGQLRRTQLITTFGSGAIADLPDYSVIIAATDNWKEYSPELHDPNLEKLLGVSGFKEPYASANTDGEPKADIPALRFPIWHFCPNCGRLMPYWGFGDEKGRTCKRCHKNIVPSRFIAACVNGHLEDFPYKWWVHNGDLSDCPAKNANDKLKVTFSDETGGLESIIITCTACGKSRSMAGSLSDGALKGYHCWGKRPWIGIKSDYNDPVPCEAEMRGLQRGASNVYFAQTASALTIPPWSSQLNQEIEANWSKITDIYEKNNSGEKLAGTINGLFYNLIYQGKYTEKEIKKAIDKWWDKKNTATEYTRQDLYEDEYQMFCVGDYEQDDDYQFRIESTEVADSIRKYIDDVILVKRLREVLALRGFRRIFPDSPDTEDPKFKGYHMDEDCVPLSQEKLDWLPAIEMLGEGIFIRLNENRLHEWEQKNENYYERMAKNLSKSNVHCDNFSPRYVLLHTLSHLLIRQLTIECGYSGAAIKERIYSSYDDSINMSGILMYTSTSDSDGSLGGLVRNGKTDAFERILMNALQDASWCSSDPVCIESKAQGYDSLNYAACHACALLPETSCEMRNCLLDRGAVVGSITDRERGYFGELLLNY